MITWFRRSPAWNFRVGSRKSLLVRRAETRWRISWNIVESATRIHKQLPPLHQPASQPASQVLNVRSQRNETLEKLENWVFFEFMKEERKRIRIEEKYSKNDRHSSILNEFTRLTQYKFILTTFSTSSGEKTIFWKFRRIF